MRSSSSTTRPTRSGTRTRRRTRSATRRSAASTPSPPRGSAATPATVRTAYCFLEAPGRAGRAQFRRSSPRRRPARRRAADRRRSGRRVRGHPHPARGAVPRLPGAPAPVLLRRGHDACAASTPERRGAARPLRLRIARQPRERRRKRSGTRSSRRRLVRLPGWRRRWSTVRDNHASEKTFARRSDGSLPAHVLGLNLEPSDDPDEAPNGVVLEVSEAELERLDLRELRYDRFAVGRVPARGRVRRGLRLPRQARSISRPRPPDDAIVIASYAGFVEAAFEALGAGRARSLSGDDRPRRRSRSPKQSWSRTAASRPATRATGSSGRACGRGRRRRSTRRPSRAGRAARARAHGPSRSARRRRAGGRRCRPRPSARPGPRPRARAAAGRAGGRRARARRARARRSSAGRSASAYRIAPAQRLPISSTAA